MSDNHITDEEKLNPYAEVPYNAADPKEVAKANKRAKRHRKEELNFVHAIMSSATGRKWMYDQLALLKVFASPIVLGDVYLTYHNLGEQNYGKKLLQDINECAAKEYVIMMEESKKWR